MPPSRAPEIIVRTTTKSRPQRITRANARPNDSRGSQVKSRRSGLTLALVDTSAVNISHVELVPTAKDSQALVRFDGVRIPASDIVGAATQATTPMGTQEGWRPSRHC